MDLLVWCMLFCVAFSEGRKGSSHLVIGCIFSQSTPKLTLLMDTMDFVYLKFFRVLKYVYGIARFWFVFKTSVFTMCNIWNCYYWGERRASKVWLKFLESFKYYYCHNFPCRMIWKPRDSNKHDDLRIIQWPKVKRRFRHYF